MRRGRCSGQDEGRGEGIGGDSLSTCFLMNPEDQVLDFIITAEFVFFLVVPVTPPKTFRLSPSRTPSVSEDGKKNGVVAAHGVPGGRIY